MIGGTAMTHSGFFYGGGGGGGGGGVAGVPAAAYRTNSIFVTAMSRWLNVSELEALLLHDSTPLSIATQPPPFPPPSGTLILYDRAATRNYKDDGYEWIKKKNSPKVREDHVKLRVGGRYRVAGCYVHCATNPALHRRAYHLLDPETGTALHPPTPSGGNTIISSDASVASSLSGGVVSAANGKPNRSLVLVHYLDTDMAALHAASLAPADRASDDASSASGSKRKGRRKRTAAGFDGKAESGAAFAVAAAKEGLQQAITTAAQQMQMQQLAQQHQAFSAQQQQQGFQQQQQQSAAAAAAVAQMQQQMAAAQQMAAFQQAQQQQQQAHQQQQAIAMFQQAQTGQVTMSSSSPVPLPAPVSSSPIVPVNPALAAQLGMSAQFGLASPAAQAAQSPGMAAPPPIPPPSAPIQSPSPPVGTSPGAAAGFPPGSVANPQPLRNEEQLHKLQARLHHQDQQARAREEEAAAAAVVAAAAASAPGASAAAGTDAPKSKSTLSGENDDTLDILWGMVVEEGGDGDDIDYLLDGSDLAGMLEGGNKIGDMLEDTDALGEIFDEGSGSNVALSQAEAELGGSGNAPSSAMTEEENMAALAASAVSAFEAELRETRRIAAANDKGAATVAGVLLAQPAGFAFPNNGSLTDANAAVAAAAAAGVVPGPGDYQQQQQCPSLQHQLDALRKQQHDQQILQQEAELRFQLAQHQQLQTQLQERGTLQPQQLQQATAQMEEKLRNQVFVTNGASPPPQLGSAPTAAPGGDEAEMEEERPLGQEIGEILPEIVDFTPESVDLRKLAQESVKVVLSCSSPIPPVPTEADEKIFKWHIIAAFVGAEMNKSDGSILEVHSVDLSAIRQLNPYTYRCTVPSTAKAIGDRRIIIVAVRLYAGTEPVCEGVAAGVAVSLKQAWKEAVGRLPDRNNLMEKPKLTDGSSLAPPGQIKLLTQFSEDVFIFQ